VFINTSEPFVLGVATSKIIHQYAAIARITNRPIHRELPDRQQGAKFQLESGPNAAMAAAFGRKAVPGKSGQVMKNPRLRYVGKRLKCWIISELVYFGAFMTGMFAELTIRGVEIERHIVLLLRP